MLDELRNLKYRGGRDGLLFFLCDVIGCGEISIRDAEILCSHAPGGRHLSIADLVEYCLALGWVKRESDIISLSPELTPFTTDMPALNDKLISTTLEKLFAGEILSSAMFSYDAIRSCYTFKNELLPLSLSAIRNVLISQGFMLPFREGPNVRFFVASTYEAFIASYCKSQRRQFSLKMLKKQLEDNDIAGERAEQFVLSFEKRRIGLPLSPGIKQISVIDATAGYDIASFNSCQSHVLDRFIEVKAISKSGFFWSKNEYNIAKLLGEQYYLYLVELVKINDSDYVPEIIQNPACVVMKSDDWFIEAQSYHIKRV